WRGRPRYGGAPTGGAGGSRWSRPAPPPPRPPLRLPALLRRRAMTLKRAIVSVHRKDGVVDLGRGLVARGFEVVSTGGTAKALREGGVPVRGVSEVTGFPEILGGRVKTLHPAIHGGILARSDVPEHRQELEKHGVVPVTVVVVNLYPFEETVA